MSRIIFHVDVNSAYLSWEATYRLQHGETLDLRTIPSAIGGNPKKRHGIILTKSIPAKKYKIKTGESLMEAYKKCPNLHVVAPNYALYMKCSNALTDIFKEYFHKIDRYSIDESFLDFTNMEHILGPPVEFAYFLKNRIKKELGFTVSVGISSNKLLAKMASDMKKPDAVTTLFPDEIKEKMWPLPIEDLFMVGRATSPKLRRMGIHTIGDIAKMDHQLIKAMLKSHGSMIWNYANGIEYSEVKKNDKLNIKGIGNSTTISFDVTNEKEALMFILSLCETVTTRLRESGYIARTVVISIKTNTFNHWSHQCKLNFATNNTTKIFQAAKKLFRESWNKEPIRHLGVRVTDFEPGEFVQLNLFDDDTEKQEKLDKVIDDLRNRFSSKAISRGCFANSDIKGMIGGVGDEDDYPMMRSLL
jgi:DNA polymerase-4